MPQACSEGTEDTMKLATYKDGSRDGQLVVVSRDLGQAHYATGIASRMQQVLDDWSYMAPQLQDLYHLLNSGKAPHAFAFDPRQCMAPLPRAYQWAVVTADVPMGATPERALGGVRLVMLANDVSLRNLIPDELSKGFGFLQSKPATAFSPVAVTLDELGDAWKGGRLHLTLQSTWNGRKVGMCDAGEDMVFHFGQLIAHLCKTRNVRAGSIVGSGTVSNKGAESGKGKNNRMEWPKGYSCIAEKRCMETLQDGAPKTEFMRFGDTIRIEMKGKDGQSIFGAIDQNIVETAE
jgi:2-keto-4-pentenoate hydratase/2-oxohepta-3-ene-1,7-dioic acid hydratase in catechol pathway